MKYWRPIIIAVLVALLSVGGWSAQRAATMADRHPTRPEFEQVQQTIKDNYENLDEKVQKLVDHLID
jgi:hypothetical protein